MRRSPYAAVVHPASMTKPMILFVLLAACGGSQKVAEPPTAPAPTPEKAIGDFHDVLAPLWHADPGPQRTADTCQAAPKMVTLADDVVRSSTPAWAEKANALKTATAALVEECATTRAAFDTKFHEVHEAFHATAETGPHAH